MSSGVHGWRQGSGSLSQLGPLWAQHVHLGSVCGVEEGLFPVSPAPAPSDQTLQFLNHTGPGLRSPCDRRDPAQVLASPHLDTQMFAFLWVLSRDPTPHPQDLLTWLLGCDRCCVLLADSRPHPPTRSQTGLPTVSRCWSPSCRGWGADFRAAPLRSAGSTVVLGPARRGAQLLQNPPPPLLSATSFPDHDSGVSLLQGTCFRGEGTTLSFLTSVESGGLRHGRSSSFQRCLTHPLSAPLPKCGSRPRES